MLGDDALACLRDLKRWLKLYDEKTNRLDVARCLAEANLVNGDLLPILAAWPEGTITDKLKSRVALACLELLVPLTWPLEHGGEMTVNHHRHTPYIQQAQVLYKAGALGYDTASILRTIVRIGLPAIAMRRDEPTTRDEGIIKLMLYFFRNITIIAPIANLPTHGLENEISRSATIDAFRHQDVFALLLTMCSNMGEDFDSQDVILLEIIFNLIKGVEVEKLWMTEQQKKTTHNNELKSVISEDIGMHRDAKKQAPSRHGRFGTMIWVKREDEKVSAVSGQNNLRDDQTTFSTMDKTKKWNKPQQRRKDIQHTMYDFDRSVRLTALASGLLRNFAEEFLDSGFNPLITHLRKAIEREAERLQDVNYRQFFYVVAWFLQAERARRERQKKDHQTQKLRTDFEAESFGLVAAVLNQETFITLNRFMQVSYDNKEWQDLNASMRCFTQILLTVQEMAASPLEDDQEIADNIQNRIFYEETTHDRIASILKGYKDQGFGYLDACTELAHVFLRMLERYSKENADLQIRSRRRARRKKKEVRKEAGEDGEDEDVQSENEDAAEVARVSRERKFDFTRFAAKFTSQASVDTFTAFVTFYKDLSAEQLKKAHRFFYRVAFKQDLPVLLYRVDIIALFYKMIKGPEGLDVSNSLYKEWNELSRQVFKKLFKKLDERPELMVELLFSKINATLYYLEYGREKQTAQSSRIPVELEVRPAPGRGIEDKIGVVIAALQRDEKTDLVRWIKGVLQRAKDERQGWEGEAAARAAERGADQAAVEPERPPYITVRPSGDEVATAMFKNARLKLLMTLVGFESLGIEDTAETSWIVHSGLASVKLAQTMAIVEKFLQEPWTSGLDDEAPEDLLRRVRHNAAARDDDEDVRRDAFIDDSEGEDAVEDFMFPDNIRSKNLAGDAIAEIKRKRHLKRKREAEPLADDVTEARRRTKEAAALERRLKIKSELYIRDSDDEDDDTEFFAREEEGRKKQEERIMKAMALGIGATEKAEKHEKRKKRKERAESEEEDLAVDSDGDMSEAGKAGSVTSQQQDGTEDEIMEDTPLSSQSQGAASESVGENHPLKELRQPPVRSSLASKVRTDPAEDEDGDEGDTPVASTRRRYRAGFIIDSDDDE